MMNELPDNFKTARGVMGYSLIDTGDRYLVFNVEEDDFDLTMAGRIIGMIIPAEVSFLT